jgi:hypothetical protein
MALNDMVMGDGDGDDGVEREQEGGGAKKTHQKPTKTQQIVNYQTR